MFLRQVFFSCFVLTLFTNVIFPFLVWYGLVYLDRKLESSKQYVRFWILLIYQKKGVTQFPSFIKSLEKAIKFWDNLHLIFCLTFGKNTVWSKKNIYLRRNSVLMVWIEFDWIVHNGMYEFQPRSMSIFSSH